MENRILIDDPEKRQNNQQEQELHPNITFRYVIGRKEFTVKINPDKDGLIIREVSGEALSIQPHAQNSINIY